MKQSIKQTIGAAAAKVGQFVDEHKKGITASVGGLAAVAQLLAPVSLAAQEAIKAGQTRNNNYQAVVGRIVTAYVIKIFEDIPVGKQKSDIILYDVDGDGNTTNDQKACVAALGYARQNGIRTGSVVTFIETQESATVNKLNFTDIQTLDGQRFR